MNKVRAVKSAVLRRASAFARRTELRVCRCSADSHQLSALPVAYSTRERSRALAAHLRDFTTAAAGHHEGFQDAAGVDPLPAHLSYNVNDVKDMPTLLLVAESAMVSEYREASFWRTCSLQVQRLLHEAPVSDLARFAELAANAGFRDDELMYNVGDALLAKVDQVDTDTLATVLRTHVQLNFRNDRVLSRLETAVFEQMQQSRATASGLSSALLALARLHVAGLAPVLSKELLDAAARMVTEHLTFFSAHQICEVLEAYATCRIQGDRQVSGLLTGAAGVFAREPESLSASNCAIAVRAFAKCRVHDERVVNSIGVRLRNKEVRNALTADEIGSTLYGFAKFTCQDTALMDLLSIEARRSLHSMAPPVIGSVLSSIAKAGVTSPVLSSRAAVQLKRLPPEQLDMTTHEELCGLVMAFGKLQIHDEKLFDVFAESFLRRTSPPLAQQQCDSLLNIIHAFTKVHITHSKLFAAIGRAMYDRFNELTLRHLVKYVHGIAKVEYLPAPALQEKILQALQKSDAFASLGVFDLLKLAAAAKRLGFKVAALEAHVGVVLPHEASNEDAVGGPGRRPKSLGPKKRRVSCRKRKWSW